MKARIQWTPTKTGFVASTQGGEVTVELKRPRKNSFMWDITARNESGRITGCRVADSEALAKRYGRAFL